MKILYFFLYLWVIFAELRTYFLFLNMTAALLYTRVTKFLSLFIEAFFMVNISANKMPLTGRVEYDVPCCAGDKLPVLGDHAEVFPHQPLHPLTQLQLEHSRNV